jgi:hypothetical protein
MTKKNEFKNYLVSIKDSETGEMLLETFLQGFRRLKADFALQELYQEYSVEYQKTEYPDTIEMPMSAIMQVDLQKLICQFDNKVSIINLHIHPALDDSYLCYPPRISSWEEAKEIIRKWFVATYFQIKTGTDPNYLESFGNFLLHAEGIELKHSTSLMDEYVEWICNDFNMDVEVEELSFEKAINYLSKEEVLLMEIDAIGLSKRAVNRLHSADIYTVRDLVQWSEEKLLKIRNFGTKQLNEVKKFLSNHKIKLD